MAWFRFYDEALDDPKVQRLPGDLFKFWVNLLCLAKKHDGILPPVADVAFALRLTNQKAYSVLGELRKAGLIEDTNLGCQPHNWDKRQYKSDTSNERVARYRERKRNATGNVTHPSHETAPETESESDTDSEADLRANQEEKIIPLFESRLLEDDPDDFFAKAAE